MKKILVESYNEVSHNLIVSKLRQSGIDCSERILTDASFPSLNNSVFGEIAMSSDFESKLGNILAEIKPEGYRIRTQSSKNSTPKYIRTGLIVYSIIITLLCLKYWYIDYQNRTDKNFNIRWNHSNVILTYTDKRNNNLVNRYKDSNYDNNFELSETYINGVGPTTIFYDQGRKWVL